MKIRRRDERGHFDHGWLETYHTFSFGDYYDPAHIRFRVLRVMNEDFIAPGAGFPMHGHRDMEIVTYVLEGALEHQDSLGNRGVIAAGELQRMSAGTGIEHSEANASATEPVHLYQVWILPRERGTRPSYEQKKMTLTSGNGWQLAAGPDGGESSLWIGQDARIYLARFEAGERLPVDLPTGRSAWLQVLAGAAQVAGESLAAGDGLAHESTARFFLETANFAEVMLFDLP